MPSFPEVAGGNAVASNGRLVPRLDEARLRLIAAIAAVHGLLF